MQFAGPQNVSEDNGSPVLTKKTKNKKQTTVEIEFLTCLDKDASDVFAPPKNPKTLLLPTSREPCNTTLPEDCHYQPENLVKLFLLPNVMVTYVPFRKMPGFAVCYFFCSFYRLYIMLLLCWL